MHGMGLLPVTPPVIAAEAPIQPRTESGIVGVGMPDTLVRKQPREAEETQSNEPETRVYGPFKIRTKDPQAPPRGQRNIPHRPSYRPLVTHPALIPGLNVEQTGRKFSTNWAVFGVAGAAVIAVIVWSALRPQSVIAFGEAALSWTIENFGWFFSLLAVAIFVFMLVVGLGKTGGIRLGRDDEKPEYSTLTWIAMMFAAGMGIGLLFYGPYEPLAYFIDPPPGSGVVAGTADASLVSLAQVYLHWGPIAWSFYALVGGAIAYGTFRRGEVALISSIFRNVFNDKTSGFFGAVIDTFAIMVTLFGTAISLGIGALQIGFGLEIVAGIGPVGNGALIVIMTGLTIVFITSAVSGVKRGIRILSNTNMIISAALVLFVFIAGPTAYLLNLIPASILEFFHDLLTMLIRNPNQGAEASEFLSAWTTYYWAWWISWSPFVGLFIAKISRGRTLREFVIAVIVAPSLVCITWFSVFGGTSMWMESQGLGISDVGASEGILFAVLDNLPWPLLTTLFAMVAVVVFFVTSADSASLVMGSMSQRGRPVPTKWATIVWGSLLGLAAMLLLLAGGQEGLSGLQSMMVVSALPFAFVVIGIMFAWAIDLRTDPYMLRLRYADYAIADGVKRGIEAHGDDFVFSTAFTTRDKGAGAWLDSGDPELMEWYSDGVERGRAAQIQADAAREQSGEPDSEDGTPKETPPPATS